jgi:hypothetical protein
VYDEDLTNLDDWLRRLKVEYDIFFNGHRKRPPDDLRLRVEKVVKRLAEAGNMTFSQRFRYNTLVARFYVMRDLWRRTMQQRELGTTARETGAPVEASRPGARRAAGGTIRDELRVSIADQSQDEEKIRRMYDAMLQMRKKEPNQAPGVSYSQFARYVAAQTQSIQEKYGCRSVQFAISLDENAIRFTARAEGAPATPDRVD